MWPGRGFFVFLHTWPSRGCRLLRRRWKQQVVRTLLHNKIAHSSPDIDFHKNVVKSGFH